METTILYLDRIENRYKRETWPSRQDAKRRIYALGQTAFADQVRLADDPIYCPECGCSSPCARYGPGCP